MSHRALITSEVCALSGVKPVTLSAWRNRLGFLPRHDDHNCRYSFADLVATRLMVILTDRGIAASDALRIVAAIVEEVDLEQSGGAKVAIGRNTNGELMARVFHWGENTIHDFSDEVLIVVSIGAIAWAMYLGFCQLRGIAPKVTVNSRAA